MADFQEELSASPGDGVAVKQYAQATAVAVVLFAPSSVGLALCWAFGCFSTHAARS